MTSHDPSIDSRDGSRDEKANELPNTFGKYQIIERITSGNMAEIFKARIEGIGGFHRYFAIKRILPHLSSNQGFVDLLVDEAKIAGLLSHANVVQILDLGCIDDHYYLAMEYVHGLDLGHILERCHQKGITLPVPHAVFICIEVLKGLEYAHNRQVMRGGRPVPLSIVHRDVSPSNILVSFQGEVKVTDFGIARASVKALEARSPSDAVPQDSHDDYLSPEQAQERDLDRRSDIFSMGVVLYEMLVGQHPFRKDTRAATQGAIRSGRYAQACEVNFDVPYSLDMILEKALAVDPADRYTTATAFKEELDEFFHESGFIFSQSTLAAFLKGLFPDRRPASSTRRIEPPRRSLADLQDMPEEVAQEHSRDEEEDFRPTVIQEAPSPQVSPFEPKREPEPGRFPVMSAPPDPSALNDAATLLRRIPKNSFPPGFGQPAGLSDAQTQIRGNLLLDAGLGEVETQIRRNPSIVDLERSTAHGTDATRPAPSYDLRAPPIEDPLSRTTRRPAELPLPPPPGPASAPLPPVPGPVQPSPVAPRQPPLPPPPVAAAPPRQQAPSPMAAAPRSSLRGQFLYLVGSIFTLLLGLFAGVVVGMRSAERGILDGTGGVMTLKEEPVLDIRFPADAVVYIDERKYPGASPLSVKLTPGEEHILRIESTEHGPVEFPITLDYNQRWLYTVEWKSIEGKGTQR